MKEVIFTTERLIVRQFTRGDTANLFDICGDAEVMQYSGDGQPLTLEQVEKWITVTLENYAADRTGIYAVIDKTDHSFIGYCGLVYSKSLEDVELIYALKQSHWNKGFASEISSEMIRYGFEIRKLEQIYASIDALNVYSKRILEKNGFELFSEQPDEFGLLTEYYILKNSK